MEPRNGLLLYFFVCCQCWLVFCQQQEQYSIDYEIVEEQEQDTFIGNILDDSKINIYYKAEDLPRLKFSILTQPWTNDKNKNYFLIEESTSVLRIAEKLDRDEVCPHKRDCMAEFQVAVSPVEFFKLVTVQIRITDINDNQPRFPHDHVTFEVLESAPSETTFSIEPAEDKDSGQYGVQRYAFHSLDDKFYLEAVGIQSEGGGTINLVLKGKLDREEQESYQMSVVAYDGGNPPMSGELAVTIKVLDVNDHNPRFQESSYEISVREDQPIGEPIVKVQALDPDAGPYGKITYSFNARTLSAEGHRFEIGPESGEIYLKTELNFVVAETHSLTVVARDQGQDSLPATTTVSIHVLDINDHPPDITISILGGKEEAGISEYAKQGTFVAHVSVKDLDTGDNGKFDCHLRHPSFHLDELSASTFQILTADVVYDREIQSDYVLTFQCMDHGSPKQVAIKTIHVKILDENDHVPKFAVGSYTFRVKENSPTGTSIGTVNATDQDIGLNGAIRYSLLGHKHQLFNIDSVTGVITTRAILDHEFESQMVMTVVARDQGTPSNSSSVTVTVKVLDINDEKPRFKQSKYMFGVYENQPAGAKVGQVFAEDKDNPPFNNISFTLTPNEEKSSHSSLSFSINRTSGIIWTKRPLDREEKAMFLFKVIASNPDQQGLSSSVSVSIYVADLNDNKPEFVYPTRDNNTIQISNKAAVGSVVAHASASDKDIAASGRISYHFHNQSKRSRFKIHSATGMITVDHSVLVPALEKYKLRIIARDNSDPYHMEMADFYIIVNHSVPYVPAGEQSYHLVLSRKNLTIVVSVASVSGFCIMVLIIAILFVMLRKNTYPHRVKYVAPPVIGMPPGITRKQEDVIRGGVGGYCFVPSPSHLGKPKKEVSFVLEQGDMPQDCIDDGWQEYPQVLYRPGGEERMVDDVKPMCHPPPQMSPRHQSYQHSSQMPCLQSTEGKWLEQDNGSAASSADMSNADSGHGASEEGSGSSEGQIHGNIIGGENPANCGVWMSPVYHRATHV